MAEHVVFVGNPGAGKSSLLNSVSGSNTFESGLSVGAGLTKLLQTETVGGITYTDTPGLDDQDKRDEAAAEIAKALRLGGSHRLFFVIKLDAGRLRPADSYLMRVVLNAIHNPTIPFYIIINQLSQAEYARFQAVEEGAKLQEYLLKGLSETSGKGFKGVFYVPRILALDGQNNAVMPDGALLQDLRTFVQQAKPVQLEADKVQDLNIDMWGPKLDLVYEMCKTLLDPKAERPEDKIVDLKAKLAEMEGGKAGNPQVQRTFETSYYPPAPSHPIHINPVPGIPHPAVMAHPPKNDECWNTDWLMFILGFFFVIPYFIGSIMGCARRRDPVTGRRHRNSSQQTAWILNTVFSGVSIIWIVVVIIQASTAQQQQQETVVYYRY